MRELFKIVVQFWSRTMCFRNLPRLLTRASAMLVFQKELPNINHVYNG